MRMPIRATCRGFATEAIATGARRHSPREDRARVIVASFDGPRRVSATARRCGIVEAAIVHSMSASTILATDRGSHDQVC
jgi:transposase-like protein